VQFVESMTFNVESEFLSLFVHGYKTAESRGSLVWPIWRCDTYRRHEDERVKVKECLQAQHGFETQEGCQWALVPPTDVEGFVSGKIWAIARMGDTSDVRKVERQRLHTLLFDEARAKYSDIAGSLAANKLRDAHQHQNRGLGVTKAQYIDATMDCMENGGVFNTIYDK